MIGRRKTRMPSNDRLIISLLDEGRIKVEEDGDDLVREKGTGRMLPRTKIYVRDLRSKTQTVWREQTMHPKFHSGHLYFSIFPAGRKGGMVWLSARRVVWYAFQEDRRLTSLMICTADGDPANYNRWNLVARDQNDQNVENRYRKEFPEMYEDDSTSSGEIPF